jgi:hypothetical protein
MEKAMSFELPPPNAELFSVGMLAEISFGFALRLQRGMAPGSAYLDAAQSTVARYKLDGNADELPEADRRLLEQLRPVIGWWERLLIGLTAADADR